MTTPAMPGGAPAAGATLTIHKTAIGNVLADVNGHTIYWYKKDKKGGPSTCTGACATVWPMVGGKPVAAPGTHLVGKLGSVMNLDGMVQATYNGHPLYTYSVDTAPGMTQGNKVGGVWHVIRGKHLTGETSTSGMGGSGMTPSSPAGMAPASPAGGMPGY